MYLGVGDERGNTKIMNLRFLDFESQAQFDNNINTLSFSPDSRLLIWGCNDGTYGYLPNVRPEGIYSKSCKLWVILMIIVYLGNLLLI